jgi:succinoglycan biosynthesis protein ExoL
VNDIIRIDRGGTPPKILFLAHDLSDPAVGKRIAMLKAGGADVLIAGFRRSDAPIEEICGCRTLNLGQTKNAAFFQRIAMVVRTVLAAHHYRDFFAGADIILARNLEMLAVAARVRALLSGNPAVVYEMLDIHRLLLKKNITGFFLRALETKLVRHCAAIVTSSPAFIGNYFRRFSSLDIPIRLVENKLLDIDGNLPAPQKIPRLQTPPWRIGWFGILRCRQSLLFLQKLVQENGGRVEVIMRGRPALNEMPDFHDIVAATPGLQYLGPYKNPEDLAEIYGQVHFAWAIDMFEEGLNSSWLLPNRIYEGSFYGAVPIAIDGVETGNFLRRLNIGIILKQPLRENIINFFATFAPDSYNRFVQNMVNVPRSTWVYDLNDCRAFADWLYECNSSKRIADG